MAAESIASSGFPVTVYERKPNPGRKFLLAGRGGLNLTHSEDIKDFILRYGEAAEKLRPAIEGFPPSHLREWCEGLGQPTFVGSSGRVFPQAFKASPLLRAWRTRLEKMGVKFSFRHQWQGWAGDGSLIFINPDGKAVTVMSSATVLALGGASWPHLGADGGWVDVLEKKKIPVTPLRPANCGFVVAWSEIFHSRFAGQPVKPVKVSFAGLERRGEMMVTEKGVEGGVIYALSSAIRAAVIKTGSAAISLDLHPDLPMAELTRRLANVRGARSIPNTLKKAAGLSAVSAALVREGAGQGIAKLSPPDLAALIKGLPLQLEGVFPLDRAISTAGGIALEALDGHFMIKEMPGVFAVGEMLDWEAPTGGYLLQAAFSTAVRAAEGVREWLAQP